MTYRLAANTMSRLMAFDACSIFSKRVESPISRAAFLNSRQVSSSLTIVRTIEPSGTFVISQMSANGVPCSSMNVNSLSQIRNLEIIDRESPTKKHHYIVEIESFRQCSEKDVSK